MRPLGKVQSDDGFDDEAFDKQHVMDRITHYRELRRQYGAGTITRVVSDKELGTFIDGWLDTLVELDELQCTGDGCSLCAKETKV